MNIKASYEIDKMMRYMTQMRPVFRKRALFCDGTEDYVSPPEPRAYEIVTLRFRAGKNNVDVVWLVIGNDKHFMNCYRKEGMFEYYEIRIQLKDEKIRYHFEVESGRIHCFYDTRGVAKDYDPYYEFQITPGFSTPEWSKGAVIYQIYVDRFFNGDPRTTVEDNEYFYIGEGTKRVKKWMKYPSTMGVREFYGGDLSGVMAKLDYLQDLGIECIYFNPLFVSPSNHKYDIQDYDYIDPHFGKIVKDGGQVLKDGDEDNSHATKYIQRVTSRENLEASNRLFIDLVNMCHSRGIKVILDGVFNHCGSFNKWIDRERIYENQEGYEKGAYVSKESPYRSFFHFNDENAWPYNGTYDGWWGHDTLPKLNYEESPELCEYILNIARKWVSPPYNVDGWRLDVAADLGHSEEYNHSFWKRFRKAVKECNPNAIILAEHYGNPSRWLQGDEWDTVMNYDAFMEPLTWFLTGLEKHSDEYQGHMLGNAENFQGAMMHHMNSFMTSSLQCSMNELSNHDHSRFMTRTNHKVGRIASLGPEAASEGIDKGIMKEAVVFQMTWPGAPTIYYGDEAGVCGFTDPDSRRTFPWGHEDWELIEFHKTMIDLHKSSPVFRTGSVRLLECGYNVISFGRFNQKEQYLIVLNNNSHEVTIGVSVWILGVPMDAVMEQVMCSVRESHSIDKVMHPVESGIVNLTLGETSAVVLKYTGADSIS